MPRPNHGPGGNGSYEKAKDFKGAIKRLFKELNTYKTSKISIISYFKI